MSIYHKDKCTASEIKDFRRKVVNFLNSHGIIPYKIKAFRYYNGEVRLYKSDPKMRLRLRTGRKFVAFKNPDGTYEGDKESIEILKSRGGDELWEYTNDPIPCSNYTQVFRADNWEEEKKAILDFFQKDEVEIKQEKEVPLKIHVPDTLTGTCYKCGKNIKVYGKYCNEIKTNNS